MQRLIVIALFAVVPLGCGQTATQDGAPAAGQMPPVVEQAAVEDPAGEEVPEQMPMVASEPVRANISELVGLESRSDWFVEKWGNPVDLSSGKSDKLGHYLQLDCQGGKEDKSAIALLGNAPFGENVRVDFFNPAATPVKVAVGIFMVKGRKYFESPVISLPRGWSSHALDMTAPQWKSAESNWEFKGFPGTGNVGQVDILVYEKRPVFLKLAYLSPPAEVVESSVPAPVKIDAAAPVVKEAVQKPKKRPGAAGKRVLSAEEEAALGRKLTEEDKAEIRKALREMEK